MSAVTDTVAKMESEQATQQAQEWASMPKRKPLPAATEAPETATGTNNHSATSKQNRVWPSFALGAWFSSQRRSRKFLIVGSIVAVLLIALIIGLAVGLTVGRKCAQ